MERKPKRILVHRSKQIRAYDLDGLIIGELIEYLEKLLPEVGEQARFNLSCYDDYIECYISYTTEENDEEYKQRLIRLENERIDKKNKATEKEIAEYDLFQKLKEKYKNAKPPKPLRKGLDF